MAKKAARKAAVPRLSSVLLPTGRFEEAWTFWTEIAGGKAVETWGENDKRAGTVRFAGTDIVVAGSEQADEDRELGYPVKHGMATLYFQTPDLDALYHALANRGAKILRGPIKTHWGAKVMTVRAGDAVVAFIESKKKG